jgi:hypothetical protein
MKYRTADRKQTEMKRLHPRVWTRYVTEIDLISAKADDAASGDGPRIERLRERSASGRRNA